LAGVISELPIQRVIFESKLYTVNNQREFCHAVTQSISNAEKTLLIIGHNPTISQLASNYTEHGIELGTGEFIIATMEAPDWPTALESSGCWSLK
jgi:phosphohistidine phosphatase SixA